MCGGSYNVPSDSECSGSEVAAASVVSSIASCKECIALKEEHHKLEQQMEKMLANFVKLEDNYKRLQKEFKDLKGKSRSSNESSSIFSPPLSAHTPLWIRFLPK